MRPVRIIAALLFAATVGTLTLLAAPAWATPIPAPVVVHVSPNPVVAGHTVTLSGSVGPESARWECPGGVTLISQAFTHTQDFAGLPAVVAAVKPGGAFTTTTKIPRSKPAGSYTITGRCGGGNLGVAAKLVVRAAASPTTTPAPTAPAATGPPIDQPLPAPAVTGPPNQPAATAAAQAASRWIPWLAALGSGTLAALGVWLLYRRQHPAGPSRQERSRIAH